MIKTLETERLILRELKLEDAEEVYKNWTSDDEVSKYVRWNTHKNIEETREYLRTEEKRCNEGYYYTWGITLKENSELIGAIAAYLNEKENRTEIGYNIAKKHWNNGYTTEALKIVMDYLINDVGIKHFRCAHAVLNPASGRVMQKAGFKYVKNEICEKFDGSSSFECKVYYLDA